MDKYAGLTPGQKRILDESVHEIGLPVRTANHLEEREVFTVRELLECTKEELLAIPNFGEKTLREVYVQLAKFGLMSADYVPPAPKADAAAEPKLVLKVPPPFKPKAHQFREKPKPKG